MFDTSLGLSLIRASIPATIAALASQMLSTPSLIYHRHHHVNAVQLTQSTRIVNCLLSEQSRVVCSFDLALSSCALLLSYPISAGVLSVCDCGYVASLVMSHCLNGTFQKLNSP